MTDVVDSARAWIGTPYVHQAALRGVGCDCLGLLIGVWRERGGAVPSLPAYSMDWSEASGRETLWQALRDKLLEKPIGAVGRSDVVLFRMREGSIAKHLGVIANTGPSPTFIHSMSGHGVIESRLTPPWQRRIVAIFAWPDTEKGA